MRTKTTKTLMVTMMAVAVVLGVAGFAAAQFVRTSRVQAYATDRWTVWATSGNSRVVVDGDGDTDLDCFVYDRNGRLLGKDDDYTDYCIVDIYQARSGNVRVVIENLGDVWNEYTLRVR